MIQVDGICLDHTIWINGILLNHFAVVHFLKNEIVLLTVFIMTMMIPVVGPH